MKRKKKLTFEFSSNLFILKIEGVTQSKLLIYAPLIKAPSFTKVFGKLKF